MNDYITIRDGFSSSIQQATDLTHEGRAACGTPIDSTYRPAGYLLAMNGSSPRGVVLVWMHSGENDQEFTPLNLAETTRRIGDELRMTSLVLVILVTLNLPVKSGLSIPQPIASNGSGKAMDSQP